MNFSAIEDSVLEKKKKFSSFLPNFLKNSRILMILLTATVITAVSVSIWMKSPEYQVLYDNISIEDGTSITNQLNQLKVPYQFNQNSTQLLVPKNKIDELRSYFEENNLPKSGIGFELLDKEKFGISQFNEHINYQRALEGELSRTIQKINIIKNARIHIALPKTSLFLKDKKKPSVSVIVELKPGKMLDSSQINAILHLISSSITDLSIDHITIIDQSGNLLNHASLGNHQNNDLQLKYIEEIESRYNNRIKSILEPLLGIGNIDAQVTAQIDFNIQEKTQEQYLPNRSHKRQAIRSRQDSIHNQIQNEKLPKTTLSELFRKKYSNKNLDTRLKHNSHALNSNLNHDYTVNYELNHTISNTKMNTGEIKRLSVGVVINFIKNQDGKLVPLTLSQMNNIKKLICEVIGYSKNRGDTIHIVNGEFVKYNTVLPTQLNHSNNLQISKIVFTIIPWVFSVVFLLFLLKKYIFSFSNKKIQNKNFIDNDKNHIEQNDIETKISELNMKKNLNTDILIHKICSISNQNPRTIALIIREWMSDKI